MDVCHSRNTGYNECWRARRGSLCPCAGKLQERLHKERIAEDSIVLRVKFTMDEFGCEVISDNLDSYTLSPRVLSTPYGFDLDDGSHKVKVVEVSSTGKKFLLAKHPVTFDLVRESTTTLTLTIKSGRGLVIFTNEQFPRFYVHMSFNVLLTDTNCSLDAQSLYRYDLMKVFDDRERDLLACIDLLFTLNQGCESLPLLVKAVLESLFKAIDNPQRIRNVFGFYNHYRSNIEVELSKVGDLRLYSFDPVRDVTGKEIRDIVGGLANPVANFLPDLRALKMVLPMCPGDMRPTEYVKLCEVRHMSEDDIIDYVINNDIESVVLTTFNEEDE